MMLCTYVSPPSQYESTGSHSMISQTSKSKKTTATQYRRLNQKGAIELSMNMLVVIILSLVIVGGGVTLLYKFVGSAIDIEGDLDSQTQEEIERILIDEGRQTAMPIQTKMVEAGDSTILGLGIRNIKPSLDTFSINIEFDRMIDINGMMYQSESDLTPLNINPEEWLLYNTEPFDLETGGYSKEGISINIPKNAPKGEYVYKAKVTTTADNLQYGRTQPFTIQIK